MNLLAARSARGPSAYRYGRLSVTSEWRNEGEGHHTFGQLGQPCGEIPRNCPLSHSTTSWPRLIPVLITPTNGGSLVLRVDPRAWFANVELAELEPVSPGSDLRIFPDESTGQPATNLYGGLRAATGAYRFEWIR